MIYFEKEKLKLREMLPGDAVEFAKGFAEQGWHKNEEYFMKYFDMQESGTRRVIIAEFQGQVAGYVTLLPEAETGPFAHKNIPEIVDFNVLIKYQKQGIGGRIMDVAEELASGTSDYVSLAVGLHYGYGSAQRMYVKREYIPDGSGVWYRGSQLEQYVACENDDDLNLYLIKKLR